MLTIPKDKATELYGSHHRLHETPLLGDQPVIVECLGLPREGEATEFPTLEAALALDNSLEVFSLPKRIELPNIVLEVGEPVLAVTFNVNGGMSLKQTQIGQRFFSAAIENKEKGGIVPNPGHCSVSYQPKDTEIGSFSMGPSEGIITIDGADSYKVKGLTKLFFSKAALKAHLENMQADLLAVLDQFEAGLG